MPKGQYKRKKKKGIKKTSISIPISLARLLTESEDKNVQSVAKAMLRLKMKFEA